MSTAEEVQNALLPPLTLHDNLLKGYLGQVRNSYQDWCCWEGLLHAQVSSCYSLVLQTEGRKQSDYVRTSYPQPLISHYLTGET